MKISKPEIQVGTTANTVYNAVLVRIYSQNLTKVNVSNSNNEIIGSLTLPSGSVEVIEKRSSDFISANTGVILCSYIAYK